MPPLPEVRTTESAGPNCPKANWQRFRTSTAQSLRWSRCGHGGAPRLIVKFFAEAKTKRQSDASLFWSISCRLAERLGFEPVLRIENKELIGLPLPRDPLES